MYFTPLCTRACYNVTVKYPECVLWNRQEVTEAVRGDGTPPTCQKPTMAMNTTTDDGNSVSVRPRYLDLGTDAEGAVHTYRTTDETIHVVQDDQYEVVELSGRPVEDWMDWTERERGWAHARYGGSLVDMLADAREGSA